MSQPRPRKPAGRFLGPTTLRTRPLRDCPTVADEPDLVDRIRTATNIRDEPEVVGPRWLGDWADVGDLLRSQQHAIDVAQAQATRPELDPENRLKDITRRARHAHVNLSREVFIMDKEIQRARTGGRKVPGRILRRMENIEGLLDGLG